MAFLRRNDLITQLCRQSRQLTVYRREGDRYWLRMNDDRRPQYIRIRHEDGDPGIMIMSDLGIRFPLDKPPSGLFGRLLLRNLDLFYASWSMDIGQSSEACLLVAARIPVRSVTASIFEEVCDEVLTEIYAFHQELRDKFRFDMGQAGRTSMASDADIRFIEPQASASPGLPQHGRYRLPGR